MPRYIDADDAIYELERAFPVDDFGKIIRCISRTPIADVVERKVGKNFFVYFITDFCEHLKTHHIIDDFALSEAQKGG